MIGSILFLNNIKIQVWSFSHLGVKVLMRSSWLENKVLNLITKNNLFKKNCGHYIFYAIELKVWGQIAFYPEYQLETSFIKKCIDSYSG